MIQIPLQSIPNQSLSIQLDDLRYDLTIKECKGIMSMDIIINNSIIILGQRMVSGYPIIPYAYLTQNGNLFLITDGEIYPYYTYFGISQYLIYASNSEIGI